MRPELLPFLVCPACRESLELYPFQGSSGEVVEAGLLRCRGCGHPFPVTEGIPRMLPNGLARHPEFTSAFATDLARIDFEKPSPARVQSFEKLHRLTARAFGYEWNAYRTTSDEEDVFTWFWLTGADPEIYRKFSVPDVFSFYPGASDLHRIDGSALHGATVVDVGCGMGKYLKVVSEHAERVIGLDLSDALRRARAVTSDRKNVFLVQGNILDPPIRPASADFAYSVGVLHHTPDTHAAFLKTASLVKPGGRMSVWLYPTDRSPGRYSRGVRFIQDDVLRPITCRMPNRALRVFAGLLGRLTFARDRLAAYHARRGSRPAAYLAMSIGAVAVGRHRDPEIASFLNFDWYSPQYRSYHSEEELSRWYGEAGFTDFRPLPQRVSGIGTRRG